MNPAPWPLAVPLLAPLATWFDVHRRDLPWRAQHLDLPHPDPYAVLVSEVMLQQTQVATVIPHFKRWLERFPDVQALASATEDEVHKTWEGLGYYRRARHLQAAGRSIAEHGWPSDLKGLLQLPGLGPYTAAAVAGLAFLQPEPALDGNAFRVLARLHALAGDPKAQAEALRAWLRQALQELGPSRLTQALMELGATVCGPAPRCEACPLAQACQARGQGLQGVIPPPVRRAQPKHVRLTLLAIEARASFLVRAPKSSGLLAGLWTWPTESAEGAPAGAAEALPGVEFRSWPGWTQVYTHRREEIEPLHVLHAAPFEAPPGSVWIPYDELEALPMSNRDARLRGLVLRARGGVPVR